MKPTRIQFKSRTLLGLLFVLALLLALIMPGVRQVRQAAHRTSCSNRLRQIGLAMLNYESALGHLPIGVQTDANQRRTQSWRPALYPFIESACYLYNPAVRWDAAPNLRLIDGSLVTVTDKGGGNPRQEIQDPCPVWLRCPACEPHGHQVNYALVVGEQTAFPLNRAVKLDEITDGLENTILVVESLSGSQYWTEPQELRFDDLDFSINPKNRPGLSSYHRQGVHVVFADGLVYLMTERILPSELRALLTIAGGEAVTRQDLLDRGVLR